MRQDAPTAQLAQQDFLVRSEAGSFTTSGGAHP
jgi:hypothetical protein